MLSSTEIERILEKSRVIKQKRELRDSREDLAKIISTWNRRSNAGCLCSVEAILSVYHDLLSNDKLTITSIGFRTGFFPSKVSSIICILEREGWVKVNRKTKPYVYEVTHD